MLTTRSEFACRTGRLVFRCRLSLGRSSPWSTRGLAQILNNFNIHILIILLTLCQASGLESGGRADLVVGKHEEQLTELSMEVVERQTQSIGHPLTKINEITHSTSHSRRH